MKLRILAVAAILVGVALVPTTAWAKGAKNVTITGPGLAQPVQVDNSAGPAIVDVNRLADATGLFDAVFRRIPSPMTLTRARPAGRLGPRYRAGYELYASEDATVVVRQDVYPFVAAGFVSYTPPHQHTNRMFRGTARSGWHIATDAYNTGANATEAFVTLGAPRPHARTVEAASNKR